ncbi:MAG TPA: pyridoxamine 5'-phosphate oxidase [Gaiellaceae bacterium]|nr:pyridoxamine 5'-phosphate oxidase [Gaiellaceae bacterium]
MDERDLLPDPLEQFRAWFDEAPDRRESMALATADASGAPSVRMVLLKGFDERGFVFHTNYGSRKGRELETNPRAALLFYWREPGRQVRIEGAAERTSREDSEAYFRTRPVAARFSALASPQSEPVESRADLEARVAEAQAWFGDDPPLPETWGGLRVVPDAYEFWVHDEDRLHDRFRYERDGGGWRSQRLGP